MGVFIVRAFSTGAIVATLLIKVKDFSRRISEGDNGVPLKSVISKILAKNQ